jgi:hypothetical protein
MSEAKGSVKATPVADAAPEETIPEVFTQESATLVEKLYSDDLLKIKSLDAI